MTTRILLVGGGHSHIEVVRRFARDPVPGIELTLVSDTAVSAYSGMLPGYVAGRYAVDEYRIDLAGLCGGAPDMGTASGAAVRFRAGTVRHVDTVRRVVRTSDGGALGYDLLSLNVGSTPGLPRAGLAGLRVKPIARFVADLDALRGRMNAERRPLRLAVVGAGPAGVEIALAMRRRLSDGRGDGPAARVMLVAASPTLLPGRSARARRLVEAVLRRRGIEAVLSFEVADFADGALVDRCGRRLPVDEVIWATSSAAPAWLADTGLALDENGFVRVDAMLRSLSHPTVFAAGDIASLPSRRPKAGVFAVRQGPILAHNLRQAAAGAACRRYRPQRHWLSLIATADGEAVADKFGLAVHGAWVWRWKDWSDRRFVSRYRPARPDTTRREA